MSDIEKARTHLTAAGETGTQPDQATHALIAIGHALVAIHLELQNLVIQTKRPPTG